MTDKFLLKKLKNILKIGLPKITVFATVFMVLLSLAPVFVHTPAIKETKAASYVARCTYNDDVNNTFFVGKRRDSSVSMLNVQPVKSGDQNIGFSADIVIDYVAPTAANEYTNTCTAQDLAPSVSIVRAASRVTGYKYYNTNPVALTGVTVTPSPPGKPANSLEVKGKVTISDLASIIPIPTNTLDYINIRDTVDYNDYVLLADTVEGGSGLNGLVYRYYNELPIKLAGCFNKSKICVQVGDIDDTPAMADAINIELAKIAFALKLKSTNSELVAKDQRTSDAQNFFRLYMDASKKVSDLPLDVQVRGVSPKEKILKIASGNQSSKVMLPKTAGAANQFILKKILGLGVGLYNSKIPYSSRQTIGCVPETLSTSGVALTNAGVEYEWCNLDPREKKESGVTMKMDGSQPLPYGITVTDLNLKNIFLTIDPIKCPAGKCEEETQAKAYVADVVSVLDVDPTIIGDSTIAGVFQNPAIWSLRATLNSWAGLPISFRPSYKIYIVVYPDKTTWDTAKEKDAPTWVPKPAESVGTAQIKSAATVGQSLYAFIVRVISDIIVWLQSIIYAIFATFLVPIINALLSVRPYEDAFVNIIYPGWLILRNLANIFFIVSLLVVGLRILFQQSAAGTARSFILRLVIMALLVNFSLVIAQGLVGIADTVQSQFLPANTKIIESLGQKLMVDPLIEFRKEVTDSSNNAFSTEKAELALADTIKPIVLLMLSIAAFFSFVAVAAFLLVRLVALWVLYMLSPIAYVGFVMDETKTYASRWWSEFLKYAIVTPVLVFFLNIAALMATLFSGQNNSLFKAFSNGTMSQDIVVGALTIISHFIVLFFIYAGMKFALSSGVAGAKTIVDYSKKGFDNLTTRPAKWVGNTAKDFATDAAKTQYNRRIKDGLLDPLSYRDAYKKRVADTTKEKYAARITKKDRLTPQGLIEKPGQGLKYMYYKATGRGANQVKSQIDKITDEQAKMTEPERDRVETKLKYEESRVKPMEDVKARLEANDPLKVGEAREVVAAMFAEALRLEDDRDERVRDLNDEAAEAFRNGNTDLQAAKLSEAAVLTANYDKKIEGYEDDANKINKVILAADTAAVASGLTQADDDDKLEHLDPQVKEEIVIKLDGDVDELKQEIKTLGEKISEDKRRQKEYGADPMTPAKRASLEKEKEVLVKTAHDRRAPESSLVKQVRREAESEAQKKIEDTDDTEELITQYKKAMDKNNLPLATAIAKKLAAEGSFGDLLKEHGYRNNGEDIQKFINKGFEKFSPQVRLQIMSEIGAINKKNGNTAGSGLTKIDKNTGAIRMSTKSERAAKVDPGLAKKPISAAKSMKKHEFGMETNDGRLELFSGAAKMLNQFKTLNKPAVIGANPQKDVEYERKIRTYQQDWAPTAKAILESTNVNLISDPEARMVLKDIATQKINP